MCLKYLVDFEVRSKIGYVIKNKHRFQSKDLYQPLFWHAFGDTLLEIGKEQEAITTAKVMCGDGTLTYQSGWHIFKNKRDAIVYGAGFDEVILKVKYREILAKGMEVVENKRGKLINRKVIVARFMTLKEEI